MRTKHLAVLSVYVINCLRFEERLLLQCIFITFSLFNHENKLFNFTPKRKNLLRGAAALLIVIEFRVCALPRKLADFFIYFFL